MIYCWNPQFHPWRSKLEIWRGIISSWKIQLCNFRTYIDIVNMRQGCSLLANVFKRCRNKKNSRRERIKIKKLKNDHSYQYHILLLVLDSYSRGLIDYFGWNLIEIKLSSILLGNLHNLRDYYLRKLILFWFLTIRTSCWIALTSQDATGRLLTIFIYKTKSKKSHESCWMTTGL